MPGYRNAPVDHDVNAPGGGRAQGREFVLLAGAFLAAVAIGAFLFLRVGALVGGFVPFSWERALMPSLPVYGDHSAQEMKRAQSLQRLADKIASAQGLPPEMTITVHYVEKGIPNAFATFGGHVVLFGSLLDRLEREDAVAALLAHEIAHVHRRHVIKSATGALLVSLGFSAITGGTGLANASGVLAQLPMLERTRAMEREADRDAVETLVALYGHAGGFFALFEALEGLEGAANMPNLLRSHPRIEDRLAAARARLTPDQIEGHKGSMPAPHAGF